MADAVDFQGANHILRAPPDMRPDECFDLPVCVSNGQTISCWRLTPEELEIINETGVIWLSVIGNIHPPVAVAGTGLFVGGDPIAEPLLPRAPRKQETE